MSLRITGENYVWKNEKGNYSMSVSNKQMDGSWINASIPVQFKKGVELENKTKINITDAFLTFWKGQDGKANFKIMVLEFSQVGDAKEENTNFSSDDLPF